MVPHVGLLLDVLEVLPVLFATFSEGSGRFSNVANLLSSFLANLTGVYIGNSACLARFGSLTLVDLAGGFVGAQV